jgi:hypothetical protein
MSSRVASGNSSPLRRRRTVEGSCWPCKQRRVKCDLQKPSCRRCSASETEECSYDRVLLRWKQQPSSTVPVPQLQLSLERISDGTPLAINERRAIDYFKVRLWPLLSMAHTPCPPPIALALRSQPVLQALCVFAEEHRALQERGSSKQTLERRRLLCLTSIRDQLGTNNAEHTSLSALLVAVLLLYFLEGYVNCTSDHASTRRHLAGVLAIITTLGGFQSVWSSSDRITRMLLSELASTDLTDALLQSRKPSFPVEIWKIMETTSVWWDSVPGTTSLGSVLYLLADMSFYHHALQNGGNLCNKKAQVFERALQATHPMLDYTDESNPGKLLGKNILHPVARASLSLVRAFQYAGLIYLYSAIHHIPSRHPLIQQHVRACLERIQDMGAGSKAQNCALFPLYVAGAHSLAENHRICVLETLDNIHKSLHFQSTLSIRSALRQLWQEDRGLETWSDLFQDCAVCTLVI